MGSFPPPSPLFFQPCRRDLLLPAIPTTLSHFPSHTAEWEQPKFKNQLKRRDLLPPPPFPLPSSHLVLLNSSASVATVSAGEMLTRGCGKGVTAWHAMLPLLAPRLGFGPWLCRLIIYSFGSASSPVHHLFLFILIHLFFLILSLAKLVLDPLFRSFPF